MHELALIQQVVKSIREELASRGVTKVGAVKAIPMKVGELELHGEESFRQMFEVETKGSVLEGAKLSITIFPANLNCPCGFKGQAGEGVDHHESMPVGICPKCGNLSRVEGGRGVEDIELEIEEKNVPAAKPGRKKS
jgi:hydrogenase nickel insertion protein HypA